ncbi:hypothetical protein [Cellulosilyticum sp. I15G10I2]|uniref:hypothetical protein n=1 Tax=Cellulosilyticum sp. I15G10I2 TaxID=1892843 RepID=UPI001A9A6606|nr:hypothetical protein [Cellulosilyticum sp. I15G10I2]
MIDTQLSVVPFFTADNTLEGSAGMKIMKHRYKATGSVRDVAMGEGNQALDDVEVDFDEFEYEVKYVQGRFPYFDEQAMQDPMLVQTGVEKMSANMVNELTSKFYAELDKATNIMNYPTGGIDFNTIVDATAEFGEDEDGLFLLINPAQKAQIRKNLKDDLKYVEGFVRTGYIGTINNVPVYTSKSVPADTAFLAKKSAVTVFTKKGSEVAQERDENIRKNTIYGRKCHLVALTDASKVVKLAKTV